MKLCAQLKQLFVLEEYFRLTTAQQTVEAEIKWVEASELQTGLETSKITSSVSKWKILQGKEKIGKQKPLFKKRATEVKFCQSLEHPLLSLKIWPVQAILWMQIYYY